MPWRRRWRYAAAPIEDEPITPVAVVPPKPQPVYRNPVRLLESSKRSPNSYAVTRTRSARRLGLSRRALPASSRASTYFDIEIAVVSVLMSVTERRRAGDRRDVGWAM
jgi:hypothetical protein